MARQGSCGDDSICCSGYLLPDSHSAVRTSDSLESKAESAGPAHPMRVKHRD